MKILFLDIDGVVNCSSTTQRHRGFIGIDPYMAFLVGKIVLDTDCKVVLSSSWRVANDEGIKEIETQVTKLHDVTCSSWYDRENNHHSTRGEEIQKWIEAHPEITKYAILDDNSDMLDSQLPNFFKTTWLHGITKEIAEAVTKHLNYGYSHKYTPKLSSCCNAKINWKESGVSQLSYDVSKTCSKCSKELPLESGDI